MSGQLEANLVVVFVNLVGVLAAVGNDATESNVVILCFCTNRLNDPVHGKDRIKIVGRHDKCAVGVLERGGETTAHHIPQHVKDDDVRVFQQMVLLEQLDGLTHNVSTTACACWRAARFNTHHAVVPRENKVFHAQLFRVEVNRLQHVNDGRQHLLGQGEG